jgi:hypothetical protein
MKVAIPLFLTILLGFFIGCVTSHQQVVFNSLYTVDHTTVAAYDAYLDQVIAGHAPTNGVPRVSRAFNRFQIGFTIALDAAQYNTNAIAPTNLIIESKDVINLITAVSRLPP